MPRTAKNTEAFAFPASFTQERLWLLDQMEPGNPAYSIAAAVRLRGKLDVPALHKGLQEVVRRHEVLRTTFRSMGGQVMQLIASDLDIELPVRLAEVAVKDVAAKDKDDVDDDGTFLEEVLRHGSAVAAHPFDLGRGPLLHAELLKRHLEDHVLFLVVHHVIADGWSLTILIREVMALYNAFAAGKPSPLGNLEIQYADFSQWQRQSLSRAVLNREVEHWKEKLADLPVLELPCDKPRSPVQTHTGARVSRTLPESLSRAATALCRDQEITLFMLLLAVFKMLLYRYTGNPDVVVGSPVAGRSHAKAENLIGCFLNTLVLRTDHSGNISFAQLLRRIREVTLDAYSHQDIPFEKLLEEIKPERDSSRTPLFQVFFNMLNYPSLDLELEGLSVEMIDLPETWSKFDLTLYVKPRGHQVSLDLVYKTEMFSPARMAEMLEQLQYLLGQAIEDPRRRIDELSLVTPLARSVLPNPAALLDSGWMGAVQDLFRVQANERPGAIAVLDPHVTWSYREVDELSDRLASYLLESGIQSQEIVAIYAHRSAPLVAALLGILKAGAAFLVLDPAYPAPRLIDYLTTAQPKGLLQLEAAGLLPNLLERFLEESSCKCRLVLPRSGFPEFGRFHEKVSSSHSAPVLGPDNLAYISFTSGSSGKPKGVMGRHGSLTHFIPWMTEEFSLGPDDRFSLFSALSHDPLHRDVFTPLMTGGRVCIPEPDALNTPGKAAEWMRRSGITITNLTPAIGQLLLETGPGTVPAIESLRYAFFVGDILTRGDIAAFHRLAPKATFINLYGSTETQRAVSFLRVPSSCYSEPLSIRRAKEILPLGTGMKDVQLLVLNRNRQLAGIGETGEIYVRSPHMAAGYLDDLQLTAQKFLASWFTNTTDDRLYRTGDLGRYLPNGNVESLGRADQQIKIRGFRIELGEIEAVLRQHPMVRHAAAIVLDDNTGNKRIVAYVVLEQKLNNWSRELHLHLEERLPVYMVPAAFVALDALPLMQNGKLDRRALPVPETAAAGDGVSFVAPKTDLQRELAEIMKQVLNTPAIGIDDSFFALGGHSLLAIQFIARIQESLNVKITLQQFFQSPTVAALSVAVVQAQALEASESVIRALLSELESMPEAQIEQTIATRFGV